MRQAHELPLPRERLLRDVREGALERRGQRRHLADVLAILFLASFARHDEAGARAADDRGAARLLRALPGRLPRRLLRPLRLRRARAVGEGPDEVGDPLRVPRGRRRLALAARASVLLAHARVVQRRASSSTPPTASCSCSTRGAAATSTRRVLSPITGGASQINVYGAINGANVYRPNALTGDPNHLGIMLIVPLLILTPLYLRLERGHRLRTWLMVTIGFLLVVEAATLSRSGLLGLARRRARARRAVPALPALARAARPDRRGARAAARDRPLAPELLHDGPQVARPDERRLGERALPGLQLHPARAAHRPAVRARAEHVLRLLRVRHRQDELGAALVLRRAARRDRARRHGALRASSSSGCSAASRARARSAGRSPRRATRSPRASGRSRGAAPPRSSGRSPSNAFYLTMQFYYFYAFVALALAIPVVFAPQRMKVVVLTTSYPRDADDVAGTLRRGGRRGRARRWASRSTSSRPASFQHFGIAYGGGIAQNLRAAPWKLALVPAFLAAYARAARRAARDADLVHAHWIPSALAARATGKPYVLQVWGTDVELARRAPRARAAARARRAARDRGVDVPRRRGARARRARGRGRAVRRRDPGRASASPTSRRTCSSPAG